MTTSSSIGNKAISSQYTCDLSIVIPVYNESANLQKLYELLVKILEDLKYSFEIVFVDDGSGEECAKILREFTDKDSRVLLIELARNFGQQAALSAGMNYSSGRAVIVMDADLQDPPEIIPQLVSKWEEGFAVVYAIRRQRKENFFLRIAYAAYYRLLGKMANIDIPPDAGDFCLMDRYVVDILNSMPERSRFIRGIRSWIGLKQIGIRYERQARNSGTSKYTLRKLFGLGLAGIISFSYIPLRLISAFGVLISAVSVLLAVFYAAKKLTFGLNPPGFATVVVMISFFSGVQMITLGIIGEYVGRIFEEVKQRPLYVIKSVQGSRFNK